MIAMLGVFALWAGFMLLIILALIFWVMMIIDLVKRNFPNQNDKIMWVLIVVLLGIIGALIYYFMVKRKAKK